MRLSQKAQYAICGVFDLAYHSGGEPVQVRVIGARQRIPARYLEQIFRQLRRARLVRAKRGPGGGYALARAPAEITLRDVVEALEGPLDESLGQGPPPGGAIEARPGFLWPWIAEGVGAALAHLTVEGLCREAARRAVPRASPEAWIYQI